MCDDDVVENREEKFVDFRSPDYENLLVDERVFIELLGVVDGLNTIVMPGWIMSEDKILSVREGLANGLEGLTSHHDGVTDGLFFEELQIIGKVPGKHSGISDHPLGSHGDDGS
jgi:hypothetical protein